MALRDLLDRFAEARAERLARRYERGNRRYRTRQRCCAIAAGGLCAACQAELDNEIDNNPYLWLPDINLRSAYP